MYRLIRIISIFLRQFIFPNPFQNIFLNQGMSEFINLIFGGIFAKLAYELTGSWYVSGKDESWEGSIGFLGNYFLLTMLLIGISFIIHNIYWIVGIFLVIYIILYIAEDALFNRHKSFII